ncbi:hypothetical protein KAFR_0F04420 [Kazachstania africana CBS 2517]|uniref:homocysteine S-methyltransferase n=1 Tax=Kazachstania africana (strain ATCC 22294 / BCRC 22015 / CBS 2517 / CECT 1963 / NBRC 1671 / NRRL Y-8276) TaxID=1071382 RepID=H2AXD7_KAZAF|nr:hypothetical protein KAFR_0F04420 [Kazachstania africana CBS 2517]CCF59037.1 hypothetical protein KAFR_0F04420 [Kazachstania africana CBS 2517]
MGRVPIKEYLLRNSDKILVLDGGQGTELEKRGINISSPVWSTLPFINESFWSNSSSNDRKIIKDMYSDFISAGADVLSTTTYQTSFASISENTNIQTLKDYHELLNRITKFTRECIGDSKYLVGSIGTYAAYLSAEYTGDFGDAADTIDYHGYFKPQLDNFNRSTEIDIIGFETIPNIHELRAILSLNKKDLSKPFYISLSTNSKAQLRDGTSLKGVVDVIKSFESTLNPNLILLGINCIGLNSSHLTMEYLNNHLPQFPLIVYPNSGEKYDPVRKIWLADEDPAFTWEYIVHRYLDAGARIVGGCCRTTPSDIRSISEAIKCYTK